MPSDFIPTCPPDMYLTESHLRALFSDFAASITASQPVASVFSALVNSVRQVYMAAVLAANQDQVQLLHEHARTLSEITLEHEQERQPAARKNTSAAKMVAPEASCAPENPTDTGEALSPTEIKPRSPLDKKIIGEAAETLPAKLFTLHIGSFFHNHRRDMPGWGPMDRAGWTERLQFQVFKYEEPGTIRIVVLEIHNESSHRVMVVRGACTIDGWKPLLEFYAYDRPRPGTQMVWIGFQDHPARCIFVKGDKDDKMEQWERKFDFWVPV